MAHQPPENLFCILGFLIGGDYGPFTFYKNKRGKLVFFPKAPPLNPPSLEQTIRRNQFRLAATYWRTLTDGQRQQYDLASKRASLCMNGYNLFMHFKTTLDDDARRTLQSRTGTILV